MGTVRLQREELGQHGRRRVEILERLEERRHLQPVGATAQRASARTVSTSAADRAIEITNGLISSGP